MLDAQRAQNINIMLAKFGKKSYFDLAQVNIILFVVLPSANKHFLFFSILLLSVLVDKMV